MKGDQRGKGKEARQAPAGGSEEDVCGKVRLMDAFR